MNSSQLTDDKMPVLLRGRRRAEGWLMATSETRMGSTCPTNEKGIKRKVGVRSWIVRERDRDGESTFTSMQSTEFGRFAIARNNRWAKRKIQLRVRRRTQSVREKEILNLNQAVGRRKGRVKMLTLRDEGTALSKSCASDSLLPFLYSAVAE